MGPYGGGYGYGRKRSLLEQILTGLVSGAGAFGQGLDQAQTARRQEDLQKQQMAMEQARLGLAQNADARAAQQQQQAQQIQAQPFYDIAKDYETPGPGLVAGGEIASGTATPGAVTQKRGSLADLLPDLAGGPGGTTPAQGPAGGADTSAGPGYEAPPSDFAGNKSIYSLADVMGLSGRPRFQATMESQTAREKAREDAAAALAKSREDASMSRVAARTAERTGSAREKAEATIFGKAYDEVFADTGNSQRARDYGNQAVAAYRAATAPSAAPAVPTAAISSPAAVTPSGAAPVALSGEMARLLPDLAKAAGPAASPDQTPPEAQMTGQSMAQAMGLGATPAEAPGVTTRRMSQMGVDAARVGELGAQGAAATMNANTRADLARTAAGRLQLGWANLGNAKARTQIARDAATSIDNYRTTMAAIHQQSANTGDARTAETVRHDTAMEGLKSRDPQVRSQAEVDLRALLPNYRSQLGALDRAKKDQGGTFTPEQQLQYGSLRARLNDATARLDTASRAGAGMAPTTATSGPKEGARRMFPGGKIGVWHGASRQWIAE